MVEMNAVTLYVQDLDASIAFYSQLLEREVHPIAEGLVVFIQYSESRLILRSKASVHPYSHGVGGFELMFNAYTNSKVDAIFNKWKTDGVVICVPPAMTSYSYAFLALDPDGHRLKVYSRENTR